MQDGTIELAAIVNLSLYFSVTSSGALKKFKKLQQRREQTALWINLKKKLGQHNTRSKKPPPQHNKLIPQTVLSQWRWLTIAAVAQCTHQ